MEGIDSHSVLKREYIVPRAISHQELICFEVMSIKGLLLSLVLKKEQELYSVKKKDLFYYHSSIFKYSSFFFLIFFYWFQCQYPFIFKYFSREISIACMKIHSSITHFFCSIYSFCLLHSFLIQKLTFLTKNIYEFKIQNLKYFFFFFYQRFTPHEHCPIQGWVTFIGSYYLGSGLEFELEPYTSPVTLDLISK